MAFYRSPVFGAEPYQESQGAGLPHEAPSHVEFNAFYENVQRRETLERKLSKRKSGGGNALWARKSLKRSPTAPPAGSSTQPQPSLQVFSQTPPQDTARDAEHFPVEKLEEAEEKFITSQMNNNPSLIPDSDLPTWYHKDIWASVPPPMYKASYRLHNPVGPRWYRNYHLIPPSQLRPAARPPSFFSPSFPPMGSTSLPERVAGPSRTPSGSPLPTPSSSQTRVADAAQKPRSRKPSLTTPDGIELDITDPWGATWHHPSPYDFGISPTSTAASAASENVAPSRSRRASMTGYIKRKAAPSPLSQSTSAVHLQPPGGPNVLRKLSKRKTATIGSIFGNRSNDSKRNVVSLPATPVDGGTNGIHLEIPGAEVSSSSVSIMTKSSKKEKRGSVLGRLVKKLSLLKRSSSESEQTIGREDWHQVAVEDSKYGQEVQRQFVVAEPSSIGDVNHDPSPPSIEPVPHVSQDADRSSSISVEVPFPAGRLTVVNPDLASPESTPAGSQLPLPPEKSEQYSDPDLAVDSAEVPLDNSTLLQPRPPSSAATPDPLEAAHSPQHEDPIAVPQPGYDIDEQESLPPTPPAKSRAPSPALPPPVTSPEIILQDVVQFPVSSSHGSSTATVKQTTANAFSSLADILASPSSHSQRLSKSDIPFPLNDDAILVPPRPRYSYAESSSTYSPMSTSSLAVNPPTPAYAEMPIPASPAPSHQPILNGTTAISAGTTHKQTETFKLVRGEPGRILGSTDTIVAAGQQWEVIETLNDSRNRVSRPSRGDAEKASKDKGKEKERHGNQEQVRRRSREGVPTEAKMKELPKEKEGRRERSQDEKDKEKRREESYEREQAKRRQAEERERRAKREAERERERQKEREREREAEKERERLREQMERERERERQRLKELERERERERQKEKEREREREKERERQRQKERERERERQKEKEREERERERERERQREREREEREKERQREKEREERERERQREREERQREKERERERQREREREERLREKEREKEKERQREKERERARQKERERERQEKKERKEKERDRDRDRREEQSRAHPDVQRHRTPSQSNVHHRHDARDGSTSTLPPESGTTEAKHNHQRNDGREGHRIRWPERPDGESVLNNPLPPLPVPPTRPRLERNPSSSSTRPTSEMPSAAELIALRAKEAFEMERLFKARSMYGQEPEGAAPNSISSNPSDQGSPIGAVYGSSHTAYVFQQNSRHSSKTLPPLRDAAQGPSRPFSYSSDLDLRSIPSLDSPTSRPLSNPLPEPPRASAYQPTPLTVLESGSANASDYWSKYAVTTAH